MNRTPQLASIAGASRTHWAWSARVAVLLCALLSNGCTLIGLGIGSSVPDQDIQRSAFDMPSGSTVTAHLMPPLRYPDRLCGTEAADLLEEGRPRAACGTPIMSPIVTGTLQGSDGETLWIERDGYRIGLKSRDVDRLTRETSYAGTGAAVGAVLDVITIVAFSSAVASWSPLGGH